MRSRVLLVVLLVVVAVSGRGSALAAAPGDVRVIGALDALTTSGPTGATMRVSGWAQRTNSSEAVQIHVYDFGPAKTIGYSNHTTGELRPDVVAVVGGSDRSGFSINLPLATGDHRVCVFGIGGGPAPNALLGCLSVTGPSAALGSVDSVVPVAAGVAKLSGWILDPAMPNTSALATFAAPYRTIAVADQLRPDVAAVFPWAGPNHGFAVQTIVEPGRRTVCGSRWDEAAENAVGDIGCRTITMDNAWGYIDVVTPSANSIIVKGWLVDPYNRGVSAPLVVTALADDGAFSWWSSQTRAERPDVNRVLGVTGVHGFETSVGFLTPGKYTVSLYAEALWQNPAESQNGSLAVATAHVTVG